MLSFGYSKIFDLGSGSILLTNSNEIKKFLNHIKVTHKKLNLNQKAIYYKKYLNWYNSVFQKKKIISYKSTNSFAKKLYLVSISPSLYKKIYHPIKYSIIF